MITPIDWPRFHKDLPITFAITLITVTIWALINLGFIMPSMSFGGVLNFNSWLAHWSHISGLHLGSNLIVVLFMGVLIERHVGWWRYLLMVLLVWNLTVLGLYFFNPDAVLGFSGIGLGLMVLAYFYWQDEPQTAQMIGILVILNLVFGFMPGVSWQGHALGAISGLAVYGLIRAAQIGQSK